MVQNEPTNLGDIETEKPSELTILSQKIDEPSTDRVNKIEPEAESPGLNNEGESSDSEIAAVSPSLDVSYDVNSRADLNDASMSSLTFGSSDVALGLDESTGKLSLVKDEISPSTSFYELPDISSTMLDHKEFSIGTNSSLDLSLSLMDKFLAQDRISYLDLTPLKRAMNPTSDLPKAKKPKSDPGLEITSLPPQVLAKIFSHLPGFEVLNRIVRVCKLFNEACKEPNLRLSIKIGRGMYISRLGLS